MKYTLSVLLFLLIAVTIEANEKKPPVKVIVSQVNEKDFFDELEALGTLRANESVEISSLVTEVITKLHFDDGKRVEERDLLVEMDISEEKASLQEEKYKLQEAQRQIKRLKPLVKRGAASQLSLDTYILEFNTAKARIDVINAQIAERKIKAPFSGVVGLRDMSIGALVQPGQVITTLEDDSVMKLDFSIPSVYLSEIKKDMKVQASSKVFPSKVYEAQVSSIDNKIDPVSRSIVVRALIKNPNRELKPGLLMQVHLQSNARKALVIPEEAIISDGDKNYVFVVDQKDEKFIVQKQKVTLGTRHKGLVEVIGVMKNDLVVSHWGV